MYLFRKGDWFSILALAAVAALLVFFSFAPLKDRGFTLTIERSGGIEKYQVFPDENRTFEVEGPLGTTLVRIQDGMAWIAYSPCPDKLCLAAGMIPENTTIIVCEANSVVLRAGE
ncbi:MAG TPA: NusG domain II-containing protein [Atribacteraceae bacterium]|nr:NusG domain II-containing protein [Atribacteraceae bacterium]